MNYRLAPALRFWDVANVAELQQRWRNEPAQPVRRGFPPALRLSHVDALGYLYVSIPQEDFSCSVAAGYTKLVTLDLHV